MSDRPTPEQIAAEAPYPADIERLTFLARLTSNGYVIVHPDDVPTPPSTATGSLYQNAWGKGWIDCRRHIFGDKS